jgi:preprotein translocase subunit YajC
MGVQKDKIELKIAANVKIDITKNAVGVILTPQKKQKEK